MFETFALLVIMSWITLLSFGGAFAIYKKTAFEEPHRIFTIALIVRGLIYLLSAIFIIYHLINHRSFNEINGVLSVRKLFSAFIFYIAFSAFPISVIHQGKIPLRRIIVFFIPAVVVTIAYFVICNSVGSDPFVRYESLLDVWHDRANPVIIGRIMVYVVYLAYVIYLRYYIWLLEPIYTRYIKSTQSNERFNLSWMNGYFTALNTTFFINVLLMIYVLHYFVIIYLLSAFVSYLFMIHYVLSSYSFGSLDGLKVRFTLLKPIAVTEDCVCSKQSVATTIFSQFERWVIDSRPFTDPNFSLADVVAEFPAISFNDINIILNERGLNFQSYIRECRINYAITLLEKSKESMRFKELAYKVGFDHPSSFSRAFKAVKGVSPVDYRNNFI